MLEPTNHLPGSPEKVRLLQDRYAAGVDLWHPDDRKDNGDVDHTKSGRHRDGLTATRGPVKRQYSLHLSPALRDSCELENFRH